LTPRMMGTFALQVRVKVPLHAVRVRASVPLTSVHLTGVPQRGSEGLGMAKTLVTQRCIVRRSELRPAISNRRRRLLRHPR
jgi:hypothetical protein